MQSSGDQTHRRAMLIISKNQRYYLFQGFADMRKGFDGLSGLVQQQMDRNPISGDVYVFLNRRRSMIKLLGWDQDGFALYFKRLERGRYEIPKTADSQLQSDILLCMLTGIKLSSVKKQKRYVHCV
jgi:transposase